MGVHPSRRPRRRKGRNKARETGVPRCDVVSSERATWRPFSCGASASRSAIGKTIRIYPQTLCHEHRRLARRDKEKYQTEEEPSVDDPAVGGERVAPERVTLKAISVDPVHVYPGD